MAIKVVLQDDSSSTRKDQKQQIDKNNSGAKYTR